MQDKYIESLKRNSRKQLNGITENVCIKFPITIFLLVCNETLLSVPFNKSEIQNILITERLNP